jgi:hypothetical protein
MSARPLRIAALMMLGALGVCRMEHSQLCPAIGAVTRVVILDEEGRTIRTFTEAEQIARLTTFANARRKSTKPWYDMPAPQISASFYNNSQFLCDLGSGSNFFSVACPNWSGIRPASGVELSEFKHLIGDRH